MSATGVSIYRLQFIKTFKKVLKPWMKGTYVNTVFTHYEYGVEGSVIKEN